MDLTITDYFGYNLPPQERMRLIWLQWLYRSTVWKSNSEKAELPT